MKTRRKHYKNYDVNLDYKCQVREVSEDLEWNDLEDYLKAYALELIIYKTNKKQNDSIEFILCNYLVEEET